MDAMLDGNKRIKRNYFEMAKAEKSSYLCFIVNHWKRKQILRNLFSTFQNVVS